MKLNLSRQKVRFWRKNLIQFDSEEKWRFNQDENEQLTRIKFLKKYGWKGRSDPDKTWKFHPDDVRVILEEKQDFDPCEKKTISDQDEKANPFGHGNAFSINV